MVVPMDPIFQSIYRNTMNYFITKSISKYIILLRYLMTGFHMTLVDKIFETSFINNRRQVHHSIYIIIFMTIYLFSVFIYEFTITSILMSIYFPEFIVIVFMYIPFISDFFRYGYRLQSILN